MDTIFDYVLIFVLLLVGVYLCYASAYVRRLSLALNGFIWGALGGLTFTWIWASFTSNTEGFEKNYLTVMLVVGAIEALLCVLNGNVLGILAASVCLVPFGGICGEMALFYQSMTMDLYKRNFYIMLAVGVFLGFFLIEYFQPGYLLLSALTGAFAVSIATWGYMTHEDVINLLRIFLNGGMINKPGMIICMAVMLVTGGLLQAKIIQNKKDSLVIPTSDRADYTWSDMTWKHHLVILLTLAVFVLKEILPVISSGAAGIFDDGGYPMQIAAGLYVGGIVFFAWNFGGAISFFYQMWYLLWIPFELIFGRTARLSASPETVIFDIAKYLLFWFYLMILKKASGMGKGGMVISCILGAFLYPAGIQFLQTGAFPEKIFTVENGILWLSMAAGLLLLMLIGNPEASRTHGRIYAWKKGSARYCRSCGERRKIGHKYCTHCSLEYRS